MLLGLSSHGHSHNAHPHVKMDPDGPSSMNHDMMPLYHHSTGTSVPSPAPPQSAHIAGSTGTQPKDPDEKRTDGNRARNETSGLPGKAPFYFISHFREVMLSCVEISFSNASLYCSWQYVLVNAADVSSFYVGTTVKRITNRMG